MTFKNAELHSWLRFGIIVSQGDFLEGAVMGVNPSRNLDAGGAGACAAALELARIRVER